MRALPFFTSILLLFVGCNHPANDSIHTDGVSTNKCVSDPERLLGQDVSDQGMCGVLLASRIQSMEELKTIIDIQYFSDSSGSNNDGERSSMVRLKHCSGGQEVISELRSGVSQDDIADARDGDLGDRLGLLFSSPYAIANRIDLNKVFTLARWKPNIFGEGDVAFYNLAKTSANNINTMDLAYVNSRDSSEKGYINTFNHITGQAFVTSCFSEEMADFIADVHELHNMPELTTGKFTKEQLVDSNNNPVDNYVDMINNEWGQEIGKQLKYKYGITAETHWTNDLLVSYLNDIQSYYSWAFRIGIRPFRPEDEIVIKFSEKINKVMDGVPIEVL